MFVRVLNNGMTMRETIGLLEWFRTRLFKTAVWEALTHSERVAIVEAAGRDESLAACDRKRALGEVDHMVLIPFEKISDLEETVPGVLEAIDNNDPAIEDDEGDDNFYAFVVHFLAAMDGSNDGGMDGNNDDFEEKLERRNTIMSQRLHWFLRNADGTRDAA